MAQDLRSWAVSIAKLDRLVAQIVRLLQKDGRLSTAEIARASGVSEPTVRRKVARLLEEGIITIRAVSDPFALGYAAPADIGLDVDRPKIEEVATALSRYPMIESVPSLPVPTISSSRPPSIRPPNSTISSSGS